MYISPYKVEDHIIFTVAIGRNIRHARKLTFIAVHFASCCILW